MASFLCLLHMLALFLKGYCPCRNGAQHITMVFIIQTAKNGMRACTYICNRRHVYVVHKIHWDGSTRANGCNSGSSCHRTLSLLMFTQDLHMSVCPIHSQCTAIALHCMPAYPHAYENVLVSRY